MQLLRQIARTPKAIRRLESGSLTDQEIEDVGQALMKLEAKIHGWRIHFGLNPADLDLDLGPIGTLLEK